MHATSSFERQKATEIVDTSVMPFMTYNKRHKVSLMQATAALISGLGSTSILSRLPEMSVQSCTDDPQWQKSELAKPNK
jgi:hypothetical protein